MPEELNTALMRQQIAAGVFKARQQVENYRALTEMTPREIVRPAMSPPRLWFGFIMLVKRPTKEQKDQ